MEEDVKTEVEELDSTAVEIKPMDDEEVTEKLNEQLKDLEIEVDISKTKEELEEQKIFEQKELENAMQKTQSLDMKEKIFVKKINKEGFFLEDVEIDEDTVLTDEYVDEEIPAGLYSPKWDGEKWIEGDKDGADKLQFSICRDALSLLCDSKSIEAKTFINGGYVSAEQFARYEEKLKMAKAFLSDESYKSTLSLEAEIQGVSVEDLANAIVAKGAVYENALLSFNAKIEAFRLSVNKIIEQKQFETANAIIEKAYALGADATDDDVKALFITKEG
jgi:hypothetical protein